MARALGCPLLTPSSGPPFASALGHLEAEAYAAHLRFGPWSCSWLSKRWWKSEACSDSWGVTRAPPRPGSSSGLILFVAPSLSGRPLSSAAWNPGCQVRCWGGGSEGGPMPTGAPALGAAYSLPLPASSACPPGSLQGRGLLGIHVGVGQGQSPPLLCETLPAVHLLSLGLSFLSCQRRTDPPTYLLGGVQAGVGGNVRPLGSWWADCDLETET